ncbi:hypothetical protein BH10ACT7_BH10ACT7_00330 [soil metagenome]
MLAVDEIRDMKGLRVTSPARTWLDLGSMLALDDLVAVGDYLIHHSAPWVTWEQLRLAVAAHRGRGIRRLRLAVDLLDPSAESRPESRLRVMIVLAGLPRPVINHALVDSGTGKHLRPDFTFPRERVLIEYQGDYHRTRAAMWRRLLLPRDQPPQPVAGVHEGVVVVARDDADGELVGARVAAEEDDVG